MAFVLLAVGIVTFLHRRKSDETVSPRATANEAIEIEHNIPRTPTQSQSQAKLFDEIIRAAYATEEHEDSGDEASLVPSGVKPAQRRKSVATGLFQNALAASKDIISQKRMSVAVPNFSKGGFNPAQRRKSVASGMFHNAMATVDNMSQKRKSVAVPNF
ncbi:hypothetical protein CDD83_1631 [Cordyceps sp. RAO-2017]|nr:hypothetical protein CDD83_1631 [Cordyceps sp. RAO-2017]